MGIPALSRDLRGVVTYTFDDAGTRNALSLAVLAELDEALASLEGDAGVRVVVLTGAGVAFSSGADRSEIADPANVERATVLVTSVLARIERLPVPVVCRVNGFAFGAGLALVATADLSIAAAGAQFGLPEVRFGMVPGPAATACLRRVGETGTLDLVLTGRRFDAAEAARLHLIARVVPAEELDAAVEAAVAELLLGDPAALAGAKVLVRSRG